MNKRTDGHRDTNELPSIQFLGGIRGKVSYQYAQYDGE